MTIPWIVSLLILVSPDLVLVRGDGCGGRLERALESLHRESSRRNTLQDEEDIGFAYKRELATAPMDLTISRLAVEIPKDVTPWARVERCVFEPSDNSLRTRVTLKDLSVTGSVSLVPRDYNPQLAEACKMTLRLRRAGVDFFTNPIARGRGQMRIRTESSFLEPRFASIYAYGCRPTRVDKQIKRHDKWFFRPPQEPIPLAIPEPTQEDHYDAPEPRELVAHSQEEDIVVVVPNETRPSRALYEPNIWITKSLPRGRRSIAGSDGIFNISWNALSEESSLNTTGFPEDRKINVKRESTTSEASPVTPRETRELFPGDFLSDSSKGWQIRRNVAREMEDAFLRGASHALTRYIEAQLHPAIKETLMLSMGYTISYG